MPTMTTTRMYRFHGHGGPEILTLATDPCVGRHRHHREHGITWAYSTPAMERAIGGMAKQEGSGIDDWAEIERRAAKEVVSTFVGRIARVEGIANAVTFLASLVCPPTVYADLNALFCKPFKASTLT